MLSLQEWLRCWQARRNGRVDGRRAIPAPGEAPCAKYLELVGAEGARLMDRLELRYRHQDGHCLVRYRDWAVCYSQRADRLALAQAEAADARRAYTEKPTERRRLRSRQMQRDLARNQRQTEAAERRLEQAIAHRVALHREFQSACHYTVRVTERCLQEYAVANLRQREDLPPGLAPEARPRLALPVAMEGLEWDPPLDVARANKARGNQYIGGLFPAATKPAVTPPKAVAPGR